VCCGYFCHKSTHRNFIKIKKPLHQGLSLPKAGVEPARGVTHGRF
jgi:hypothetical protein